LKKIILLTVIVAFANCSRFTNIQKSTNIEFKYKAALEYYKNKSYNKASTLLEELLPLMKGQAEAEKALYTFSYAQYYQNQLILSAYWFKRFYDTYPRSEFAEEAYYMHCMSKFEDSPDFALDQTTSIEARDAVQQFLEAYPQTKYLKECNDMVDKINGKLETKTYNLAKQLYKMNDYRACAVAFDNLAKDYPNSTYIEEVMFLKIQSQYEYASQSIDSKKKERMQTALEYYYAFVDKYSQSKFVSQAEVFYDKIKASGVVGK
jgi:outer membrane protein assembly factor BamD